MSAQPADVRVDAVGPTFKFKPSPVVWRREATYVLMGLSNVMWMSVILMWLHDFFRKQFGAAFPTQMGYTLIFIGINFMPSLILRRYLIRMRKSAYDQFRKMLLGAAIGLLVTLSLMPILRETGSSIDLNFVKAFNFFGSRVPVTLFVAPLVLLFWQRGFSLGRLYINMTAVSMQMRMGILVFFVFGAASSHAVSDQYVAVLPLFFATSLLSTALSRSVNLKVEDDTQRARFGLTWFGFLTLVVVVIVTIGFMLAMLLSGVDQDKASWVITGLLVLMLGMAMLRFVINTSMFVGCVALALVLTIPFAYLASQVLVSESEQDNVGTIKAGPVVDEPAEGTGHNILADAFDFVGTGIGVGFVLLCVVIPLFFWLMMFLLRDAELFSDEDSELLDRREIMADLRKGFGKRLRRIGDALNLMRQFGGGRDLLAALSVRWTYSRMATLAEKRGFPRDKSETPNEYRRSLGRAFPGGDNEIRLITEAYVAVRYGELPENNEQLNVIRDAFERLKAIETPST
ncbi:MAG: DUF4129 domain-containing protein [Chloroflexi bacterium]|nr:DUF4129 domain-containing protein [Chloroflexota bacterium]